MENSSGLDLSRDPTAFALRRLSGQTGTGVSRGGRPTKVETPVAGGVIKSVASSTNLVGGGNGTITFCNRLVGSPACSCGPIKTESGPLLQSAKRNVNFK